MKTAYDFALEELGVKELSGKEHNPRIVEYHSTTTLQAVDDETPWCAAFVNWCLKMSGNKGTGLASAKSFLTWGDEIVPQDVRVGDIIVMSRTSDPTKGHVGFFVGWTEDMLGYKLLGGNQLNGVTIQVFGKDRILSIRRG